MPKIERQADGGGADEKRVLDRLDDALVLDERQIGVEGEAVPLHRVVLELEEREEHRDEQAGRRGRRITKAAIAARQARPTRREPDHSWCLARANSPVATIAASTTSEQDDREGRPERPIEGEAELAVDDPAEGEAARSPDHLRRDEIAERQHEGEGRADDRALQA